MRYITELDNETIKELEKIIKEDEHYKSRYRAQAILLSYKGKNVNELADIFGCKIRTIYRWFNQFELRKVEGVYELKGRGRKPLLTIENDGKKVKDYIKKTQYKWDLYWVWKRISRRWKKENKQKEVEEVFQKNRDKL